MTPEAASDRLAAADVVAVLFDGPGAAAHHDSVRPGVAVVAVSCDVGGATLGAGLPPGEIVARVVRPDHPLTTRVDPEFAIVDALTPVAVTDDSFRPVLTVSYRFVDRVAVAASGRTVACGLGHADQALADPALAALLRRALRATANASAAPSSRTLGVGIVGYGPYGGMGFIHGTAVTATPGLELVAACDRDDGRRKAAEQDFASVRAHATIDELVADDAVDVAHCGPAAGVARRGGHDPVAGRQARGARDVVAVLDAATRSAAAGGTPVTVTSTGGG